MRKVFLSILTWKLQCKKVIQFISLNRLNFKSYKGQYYSNNIKVKISQLCRSRTLPTKPSRLKALRWPRRKTKSPNARKTAKVRVRITTRSSIRCLLPEGPTTTIMMTMTTGVMMIGVRMSVRRLSRKGCRSWPLGLKVSSNLVRFYDFHQVAVYCSLVTKFVA